MGGSKTAIFTQVVHFYSGGVGHITIGGNNYPWCGSLRDAWKTRRIPMVSPRTR